MGHAQVRPKDGHAFGEVNVPGLDSGGQRHDRLLDVRAVVDDFPFRVYDVNACVKSRPERTSPHFPEGLLRMDTRATAAVVRRGVRLCVTLEST